MKLYLGSDLHLEFGPLELHNRDNADVLILSGDILLAADIGTSSTYEILEPSAKHLRYTKFMEQASNLFKHVIYVMGNHEHYHGNFLTTADKIRAFLEPYKNIHLLDRDVIKIEDVTFIGGTLWTDMNKEDSLTLYHMKSMMNDFRIVKDSSRMVSYKTRELLDKPVGVTDEQWLAKPYEDISRPVFKQRFGSFSPESAVIEHELMKQYISTVVEGKHNEKFVVVGHHAPSKLSTKPRYQDDTIMNGGYSSDLSEFILDRPQIKMWTHGHTHDKFDYMIGTTRIVCNPRGYIDYEPCADTFDFQLLEI